MNISSNESVPEQANSFRQRFLTVKSSTSGDREDLNRRIIDKRGIFKWLPVAFENDLVLGSLYLALGSFLCAIIPIFPLISINQDLLEIDDDLVTSKLNELFSNLFFLIFPCIIIIA